MGNMDALNLLIENGADINRRHNLNLSVVDEIIRNDNKALFECVYPITKTIKRNLKEVSLGFLRMFILFSKTLLE